MMIRNARLGDGRVVDLEVDASTGLISSVGAAGSETTQDVGGDLDLGGWVVVPAMAEPHAHLDKALTADLVSNPAGDLRGAIDGWHEAAAAGKFSYEHTVERAKRAMEMLLIHGVTAVRTHVNVLESTGGDNVRAVKEAAAGFSGMLDVTTVALTASPMTGPESEGNRRALELAIEAGVDLVGGCPHHEPDAAAQIAVAFAAAMDAGLDVDFHTDETLDADMLTLREICRQRMENGFSGTVTASHCVSLGMNTPEMQEKISAEVAEADVAVVTLPQTNLFLQGREEPTATPRGLTAIKALQAAGVDVAAGADNVQDPFNLVGRSDPLETAALLVMAGHLSPEAAFEMVSNTSREVIGLRPVRFEVGDPADFVAIESESLREAIADAPMSRKVFKSGRLVASTTQHSELFR